MGLKPQYPEYIKSAHLSPDHVLLTPGKHVSTQTEEVLLIIMFLSEFSVFLLMPFSSNKSSTVIFWAILL